MDDQDIVMDHDVSECVAAIGMFVLCPKMLQSAFIQPRVPKNLKLVPDMSLRVCTDFPNPRP